ncbi:MAG: tripartite tricarboxylate transporter TctB family protein, partial [Desulfobulbia bacterium]
MNFKIQIFSIHGTNAWAALFLGCIAALCIWEGSNYELGTLRDMGPGFFPVSLGVVLLILSVLIGFDGSDQSIDRNLKHPPDGNLRKQILKQLVCVAAVLGGIGLFTLFLSLFGLIPAAFAIIVVSGLAHPDNGLGSLLL